MDITILIVILKLQQSSGLKSTAGGLEVATLRVKLVFIIHKGEFYLS